MNGDRPKEVFPEALSNDPVGNYSKISERAQAELKAGKTTFSLPEIAPTIEFIKHDLREIVLSRLRFEDEARSLIEKAEFVLNNGFPYVDALKLSAQYIELLDKLARIAYPELVENFVPKVKEEFEHLLRLAPAVIVFPTFTPLNPKFFLRTRGVPVFALGLTRNPIYADGNILSPAEFFYHDVDHIRFMIREELIFSGVPVPDAYQMMDPDTPPTTFNKLTGKHRIILDYVRNNYFDNLFYQPVEKRTKLAMDILDSAESLNDSDLGLATSIEWLLYEILHEKGYPWEKSVLVKQLSKDTHIDKLRYKIKTNFFGPEWPISKDVDARLSEASNWILNQLH